MATCTKPACGSAAAWRGRDGREYCGSHVLDVTPAERLPVVAEEALHDQPHPPVNPAMATVMDDTILAARCPPGWRRSPLDGRPVMPCVAVLSSQRNEIPHTGEIMRDVSQLDVGSEWGEIVQAGVMVLLTEAAAMRFYGVTLSQSSDNWISRAVDKLLRSRGEVRIRKNAAGEWEEVGK